MAHAVGAGKTFSIAAAIMEQKQLGLISKPMLVVPGHCLAQASRRRGHCGAGAVGARFRGAVRLPARDGTGAEDRPDPAIDRRARRGVCRGAASRPGRTGRCSCRAAVALGGLAGDGGDPGLDALAAAAAGGPARSPRRGNRGRGAASPARRPRADARRRRLAGAPGPTGGRCLPAGRRRSCRRDAPATCSACCGRAALSQPSCRPSTGRTPNCAAAPPSPAPCSPDSSWPGTVRLRWSRPKRGTDRGSSRPKPTVKRLASCRAVRSRLPCSRPACPVC